MMLLLQAGLLFCTLSAGSCLNNTETYKRVLKIPNKIFDGSSELFCTAQPVDANQYFIISAYTTAVFTLSIRTLHLDHIYPTQDCSEGRICKPGTPHRVGIYTWGRQSGGWTLPPDTGVTIGNKKKYIVFEVHTGNVMDKDDVTQTGIELTLRSTRPLRESGVALLGSTGKLPPKVTGYFTDAACEWSFKTSVKILTYSVHTHSLGKAISGYIYRNDEWIEIGRADPSYPERLMDITYKNLYITPGDIVASRCTYDNPKDKSVAFGHGATDEMCNFHIHYSYPAGSNDLVRHVECAWDAETFHWEDHFPSIPLNSSNTEDSDQTFYIKKYHWTHHNYK